jgi:hypothetical protein
MRRYAFGAVVCWLGLMCGGRVISVEEPPGHAAADGAFVSADGALVIAPGSACNAFDSAALLDCDSGGSNACNHECKSRDDCIDWASQHVPVGFPIFAACSEQGCLVNTPEDLDHQTFSPANDLEIHCLPGADGDAFCSAYFDQFITNGGTTSAHCIQGPSYAACAADLSCLLPDGAAGAFCGNLELCVLRGGEYGCEAPCRP